MWERLSFAHYEIIGLLERRALLDRSGLHRPFCEMRCHGMKMEIKVLFVGFRVRGVVRLAIYY
jgi:hypothetical protein